MQELKKIGNSFWYLTPVEETDRPILGMVVGNERTLMIDAGNSEAHVQLFLVKLKEQQVSRPDIVALTHWHWDHIFGLSALKDALSIASVPTKKGITKLIPYEWTDEALAERVEQGIEIQFSATNIKNEFGDERNIEITLPTLTFDQKLEIDLGGVTCELKFVGGDHADDSVVIYVKEEKVLFLGDCFYPNIHSPNHFYTIERTLELVEQLEAYDAETYILSHSDLLSKQEFAKEAELLKSVAKLTEQHNGDFEKIKLAYKQDVARDLTEDELETIELFVNGYGPKQGDGSCPSK